MSDAVLDNEYVANMDLINNPQILLEQYSFADQAENAQSFSQGQTIFSEGEPGDKLYVVLEGTVSIAVQNREVDRLEAGSIFGEMTLVDDRSRSASAQAKTDCLLLPMDYPRFIKVVQRNPEFAVTVMSIMSDRMRKFMDEELKQQRLREELKIGRRIQHSLLPDACPDLQGWEFAAIYRSARQVGGDLYDFILVPGDDNHLNFVIADVTGKGVPAALFMASARTAFRAESMNSRQPATVLSNTNHLISLDIKSPLLLSAFYAILDSETGRVSFANGGHEPPYWLQNKKRQLQTLSAAGVLLGAFNGFRYEQEEIELLHGDCLVFFTDGVTEARDAQGNFYGEERLEETIRRNDWRNADKLLKAIVHDVDLFTGDTPPADDLTIVVIRRS